MARIQRQINLARLQNSEDSGNQRRTVFHQQRDGLRTRRSRALKNLNSQRVRTLVQFRVLGRRVFYQ